MSERLFDPVLNGPLATRVGQSNAWSGRTVLASGSVGVAVTTTRINSDSVVIFGSQVASTGVAANSGGAVIVNSLVSATGFMFARATGVAVPWDETVMWTILRTS